MAENGNIPTVLYEKDGRLARLTPNRPEKLNAINETMPDELRAAVARATEDDEAHVICKAHGFAVAGGSDIALCCDLIVTEKEARIGYPPARVLGCPTTAMWVYRIGAERAKRMLLTGDLISGAEAARIGLVSMAVAAFELGETVERCAQRMASAPKNQLMMQKLMINQAYENMGLRTTQMFATLFDGIARHTPEGVAFKARAEAVGFKQAVKERDSGATI